MFKNCAVVGLMCCGIAAALEGQCSVGGPDTEVVASINGQEITRQEFNRRAMARLFQARNTYFEAERKALEEFVDELLLEQRAREENKSVATLLERDVNSRIAPDPPDEALRVYYEGLDVKEPFQAVRDKIVMHLRQRRITAAKTAYIQSLRQQAKLQFRLAPPRIQVPLDNTPIRGNPSGAVQIVEFADYECPYCQQIQPTLDKLAEEYKGTLAFFYKDVPLPNHPNAQKAAEAKHCAGAQGKYWEYHDLLVSTKQYQRDDLRQNARALELNLDVFDKCVDEGQQAGIVAAHVREAQALGLEGTPTFLINGRFFSGVLSYEKLREVINEELRAADSATKQAALR